MPARSDQPLTPEQQRFWALAESLVGSEGVAEGTLMGSRCLRVQGEFLATYFPRDTAAIIKLNEARVTELIAEGIGAPFAPAKKVFREWVAVGPEHADQWEALIREGISLATK